MRYKLATTLSYAALLGWFAYHGDNVAAWVAYGLMFVAPFVAGLGAGLWAAFALPVVVLIAVPAGYGSGEAEVPIWLGMMIVGIIALPIIVVGWGTRWLVMRYARQTRFFLSAEH